MRDLVDGNGKLSQDSNKESEAAIAYAKIKAVYPRKTRENMANSSIEPMLDEVSHVSRSMIILLSHLHKASKCNTVYEKGSPKTQDFLYRVEQLREENMNPNLNLGSWYNQRLFGI